MIKGENDTFSVEQEGSWTLSDIRAALPGVVQKVVDVVTPAQPSQQTSTEAAHESKDEDEDKMIDYDAVVKRLVLHPSDQPESKTTPYFNHAAFFANLDYYNTVSKNASGQFGRTLLYGEVVTSTNTLLEKYVYPKKLFLSPS